MALWGNSDAVGVNSISSRVSLAYTDNGYTNVNNAGIGSTGYVLTGTATSFGLAGYGQTGDVIAIGFPKNTLGVGTYYGEAVIVSIAATNVCTIGSTDGLTSVLIGDTTGLNRFTGLGTMFLIRESPKYTHDTAQFSENSAVYSQEVPSEKTIFVGTAGTAVGIGTSAIFVNNLEYKVANDILEAGTDSIVNDGSNITITSIGKCETAAKSPSAIGFSTIYVDTTQIPHIDHRHTMVKLKNVSETGARTNFLHIASGGIAATSVSLASTIPYTIGVGSAVEFRMTGRHQQGNGEPGFGFLLGLESGVTAAIGASDSVNIQRLHGGYDAHVYSVDATLAGLATNSTAPNGIGTGAYKTSAGWVGVTTYIDNTGRLRVKKETLVAMSGITTGNYPLYDGEAWGALDPDGSPN